MVDVSTAGAGLELVGAFREEVEGQGLVVSVHLHGEVRNASRGRNDLLRVGIQFAELSPAEREYLRTLSDTQARW